ncbi:MAG TPA: hypothetical protein VE967_03920 [Gemmatimonadaceae bacterium]|nr:hypothetical protein [Gemmatimonadaceae bacterium]
MLDNRILAPRKILIARIVLDSTTSRAHSPGMGHASARSGVEIRVVVFLALSALSCAGERRDVVVQNAPGAWGAEPVQATVAWRIGNLNGPNEYAFGAIQHAALLRGQAIVVQEGSTLQLIMYNTAGKFIRYVGRNGAGPGEFQGLGAISALPDGRFAAFDGRSKRISLFAPSGDWISDVAVPFSTGSSWFAADSALRYHFNHPPKVGVDLGPSRDEWKSIDRNGAPLPPVVASAAFPPTEAFTIITSSGYDRPFPRELLSTVLRDGSLVSVDNNTYDLEIRPADAGSHAVTHAKRAAPSVRLTDGEHDEWEALARIVEERALHPRSSNHRQVLPPPRVVHLTIPKVKPAIRELEGDSEGRIWLRRYVDAAPGTEVGSDAHSTRPPRRWIEPIVWDVWTSHGSFLGTVQLPPGLKFHDAFGNKIVATFTGESGESYLSLLTIAIPHA